MSDTFVTPWTVTHQVPLSMGCPRQELLEWAASPFSKRSSWSRDQTCVSSIAGEFFITKLPGKPKIIQNHHMKELGLGYAANLQTSQNRWMAEMRCKLWLAISWGMAKSLRVQLPASLCSTSGNTTASQEATHVVVMIRNFDFWSMKDTQFKGIT